MQNGRQVPNRPMCASSANCILSLGLLALARSEHDEAGRRYDEALALYARIPEPDSISMIHRRLARIAAARQAWLRIKRNNLTNTV